MWQILDFILSGFLVTRPATIFDENNDGAVKLADNPICASRSKHIDVRHYFEKEKIPNDGIKIVCAESEQHAADGLVKNLPEPTLVWHRKTSLNEKSILLFIDDWSQILHSPRGVSLEVAHEP